MPMAGLAGSGLVEVSRFKKVKDPYNGREWIAAPAIQPDWAIIHVDEADQAGNLRIDGPKYDDLLIAKASKNVIATCERLVDAENTWKNRLLTDLPGFLVTALVELPSGARPAGCNQSYEPDYEYFVRYLQAARDDSSYQDFIQSYVVAAKGGARP